VEGESESGKEGKRKREMKENEIDKKKSFLF